jgi:hypothetical protein
MVAHVKKCWKCACGGILVAFYEVYFSIIVKLGFLKNNFI